MNLCTCNKVVRVTGESSKIAGVWCADCSGLIITTHKHRFKVMNKTSRHSVWFTCSRCSGALPIRRTAIREIFVEGRPYSARHRS